MLTKIVQDLRICLLMMFDVCCDDDGYNDLGYFPQTTSMGIYLFIYFKWIYFRRQSENRVDVYSTKALHFFFRFCLQMFICFHLFMYDRNRTSNLIFLFFTCVYNMGKKHSFFFSPENRKLVYHPPIHHFYLWKWQEK